MKKNKKNKNINVSEVTDQKMGVNDTLPTREYDSNNVHSVVLNRYNEVKNANHNNNSQIKSYKDMTDEEFIQNADRLARPYYNAYMKTGAFRNVNIDCEYSHNSDTYPSLDKKEEKETKKQDAANKLIKKYYYKRTPILLVVLLLTLLMIATLVLGTLHLGKVSPNVSYLIETEHGQVSPIDSITALAKSLFKLDINNNYNVFFENTVDASAFDKLPVYLIPVATIVLIICIVLLLIKCFVALGSKKGVYGETRKYKFVGLTVMILALSVAIFFCTLILAGFSFDSIFEFIRGECKTTYIIGYGPMILAGLSLIATIFQFFAYKKDTIKNTQYLI